jgi:hypothetical protein
MSRNWARLLCAAPGPIDSPSRADRKRAPGPSCALQTEGGPAGRVDAGAPLGTLGAFISCPCSTGWAFRWSEPPSPRRRACSVPRTCERRDAWPGSSSGQRRTAGPVAGFCSVHLRSARTRIRASSWRVSTCGNGTSTRCGSLHRGSSSGAVAEQPRRPTSPTSPHWASRRPAETPVARVRSYRDGLRLETDQRPHDRRHPREALIPSPAPRAVKAASSPSCSVVQDRPAEFVSARRPVMARRTGTPDE